MEISGQTVYFPTSSNASATAVMATGTGFARVPVVTIVPPPANVIPLSSNTEIPNPQKGQFLNYLNFPNGYWQGTTYAVNDAYVRYVWSDIHTGLNTFNFAPIDNDINTSAAAGRRFGFRIMMSSPPTPCVPGWAQSEGVTSANRGGLVFPLWNSSGYLSYVQTLLTALGNRYDRDERVAWFEISGYGDWSEMTNWTEQNQYGLALTNPSTSIATLGYYANPNYTNTMASITTLLRSHVSAWPNTRLVTVNFHPEFVRQLLTGKNFSGATVSGVKPVIPAGLRQDHLSHPEWSPYTPSGASYWGLQYYQTNNAGGPDVVVGAHDNNWRDAPWLTEWDHDSGATMAHAVEHTVIYHISMNGSNITNGWATPLNSSDYNNFFHAMLYAGYRYSAAAGVAGTNVTVAWTNWGVAPVYERWDIVYQIRNASNTVVQTVNSGFNLNTQVSAAAQSLSYISTQIPASTSANDTFTLNSLPSGSYTIWVQANWNNHKPSGTHTYTPAPMGLAMTGRDAGGFYQIGSFTV